MISLTRVTLRWTPNNGSQSQTRPRMHLPNQRPRKPDRLSQDAHSQTSYPRVQRQNTLDRKGLQNPTKGMKRLPGKHTQKRDHPLGTLQDVPALLKAS